jgi:hypothetical protein
VLNRFQDAPGGIRRLSSAVRITQTGKAAKKTLSGVAQQVQQRFFSGLQIDVCGSHLLSFQPVSLQCEDSVTTFGDENLV